MKTNFTMLQCFEWYSAGGGTHWTQLKERLEDWADCGVTSMWLPPPTKGSSTEGTGYDVYDLYDLGEFNQKGAKRTGWGTKEEFVDLIKRGKELGIISYIDAVLNHRLGADESETFKATEVSNDDRTKNLGEPYDIEGWTKFNFPGRGDKHSSQKYTFNHFTGVDYDNKQQKKAIFRIEGDNKYWAEAVDSEHKNYDYLMGADVDHAHGDVKKDLFDWGTWILKETGASGFRFDAVKHIDVGFISEFVKHIREASDNPNMFCLGEYWKDSFETNSAYLDKIGEQFSLFDCPLHYNFKEAGEAHANFDLRKIWDGSIVQNRPIDAVTLVDNHDTQVGQSLESCVASWFKPLAYALILLRVDGYPCVFYGDLYGCKGDNPQPPVNQLSDLIRARKLFAYGEIRDYWDHPNCVGWVRAGEEGFSGCAVVMSNGTEGSKRMEIGKEHAGEVWTDILGWTQGEITIEEDGWAEFKCPGESLSVWAHTDAKGREEFGKDK